MVSSPCSATDPLFNIPNSNVQSVADDANKLQSRTRISRFLNAAEYSEKVEAWIKKLSWHIQSFILEGTIALELTLHEMASDMQQGFSDMSGRFDNVDNGIAELRDDVNQLGTDNAIPGLRYAPRARFDYGRSGRSECDPDTRKEVLETIYSWIRPQDRGRKNFHELLPSLELLSDRSILWIYALAGAGKTTLAETIAKWCHEHNCLGASFFCARDGDRSDVQCIVQNIASDLAYRCPEFREALLVAIKDNPHIRTASVSQQVQVLLAGPVQAANAKGAPLEGLVVVVDALDECKDDSAESTFLHALSLHIKELAPLLFIITSRPVPNITRGFKFLGELRERTQELPLDAIPTELTVRDITNFLRRRFADIGRRYASAGPNWASEEQVERVSQLAEGLFIYAATVASFLEDKKVVNPRHQLDALLRSVHGRLMTGALEARLDALDELYTQVLHAAFGNPSPPLQARLKRILGTIVLAEERLSSSGLSALLGEECGSVLDVVEQLRSVLSSTSEGNTHSDIRIIHLSFADFLVDPRRCKYPHFLITPSIQHTFIVLRCLKLMQDSLKYNICEVPSEHDCLFNDEILDLPARIAQHLPSALQYACRYWLRHLARAEIGEELLAALEEFCTAHLLHWLEVLSLLGCVEIAIEGLRTTQVLLKRLPLRGTRTDSSVLLYECERIVQAFYPAITASFMQVYRTAIPFSPTDTLLRRLHQAHVSHTVTVTVGLEETWSTVLMSRVTDFFNIRALAFSPDGKHLAYGAVDGCIRLLNTHTGAQTQLFEGHTEAITSVSFSPTGKEILSGSDDQTARLWDAATGACLRTWTGNSELACSVPWSPGGVLVASGIGDDSTIGLRKVPSMAQMAVPAPNDFVYELAFATGSHPTPASGSRKLYTDCKLIYWYTDPDTIGNAPNQISKAEFSAKAVAVSPDGCLVACGLSHGEVLVWSTSNGKRVCSLFGESSVIALAFYCNRRLAAAFERSPFILWDVPTASRLDTMDNTAADAAAFSPDGIHTAHIDGGTISIRRWSGNALPTSEPRRKAIPSTSLAMRIKRCFETRIPHTRWSQTVVRISDDHQEDQVCAASAASPVAALILTLHSGQWRLWDAFSGQCVRTVKHVGSVFLSIAWSPSGSFVAFTGTQHSISLWEVQTGKHLGTFTGHSKLVTAVVFTADEQFVLSASLDGSIRRWQVRQPLQEPSSEVLHQLTTT
ncbi:WD40 repeat-like protein [Trametes sanguinea]|nr:WD40 repeat-like protein [Trametes sanguinea]